MLKFDLPADTQLGRWFKANPMLGHRDRGLIAESVFAVLRHKLEYAQLAQSGAGPLARRMILLGLADTAGVEPIAATLEAAERTWLRRVATVDRSTMSVGHAIEPARLAAREAGRALRACPSSRRSPRR